MSKTKQKSMFHLWISLLLYLQLYHVQCPSCTISPKQCAKNCLWKKNPNHLSKKIIQILLIDYPSFFTWVRAQMGGPIWVSHKPILPYGYHCNAHVAL
jgi:hypothetical protein